MKSKLFGRADDVSWLRRAFDECVAPNESGKFEPRMAFVIAESGIGKTRLVQELYVQLANDPKFDPPEVDYWPKNFGDTENQLLTVPDMSASRPKGPPRFAWIGARWQSNTDRSPLELHSAITGLKSALKIHAKIFENFAPIWEYAAKKALGGIIRQAPGEALEQSAEKLLSALGEGIPFGGIWMKFAKGAKAIADERAAGPGYYAQHEKDEIRTAVDEMLECMRLLLRGKTAVPTVLWLDDAQWIDPHTKEFLYKLWTEAWKEGWPLLVVVTHWERQWRESADAASEWEIHGPLQSFEGRAGVLVRRLTPSDEIALGAYVKERLPGLTDEQSGLLIKKAGGNFLSMVENISDLLKEPMYFVDETFGKPLSDAGIKHVIAFESNRALRVEQRFKEFESETRKILGWSAQIGTRFISEVVAEFAQEKLPKSDPVKLIDRCVDPYVVLSSPSVRTREFRDKAYFDVACKYREKFLGQDSDRLTEILRSHLVEWVNNSFDAHGKELSPTQQQGVAIPERSVVALDDDEARDLLGVAIRELTLPQTPELDWTDPRNVAALRAIRLLITSDRQGMFWQRVAEHFQHLRCLNWAAVPSVAIPYSERAPLSDLALTAGAYEVADQLAQDVLERARRTADAPDTADSRLDVSASLFRVARIAAERGFNDKALQWFDECLKMAGQASELQDTPETLRYRMATYHYMGWVEQKLGNIDGAMLRFQEHLALTRRFSGMLESAQSLRELSVSLNNVGSIEQERGRLQEALLHYNESLAIARRVHGMQDDCESMQDLSVSLTNVASIEQQQNNMQAAQLKYEEGLAITRRVSDLDDTPKILSFESMILDHLGQIAHAGNKDAIARQFFEESLAIRRCVAMRTDSLASRSELAVSLSSLALLALKRQAQDEAYPRLLEGLEVARGLVDEQPIPKNQEVLSQILNGLAHIEHARKNIAEAEKYLEESMGVRRDLASKLRTPQSFRSYSQGLYNVMCLSVECGDLRKAEWYASQLERVESHLAAMGQPRSPWAQ
jgi:tetratricopeptide (TPR) repeat protein